LESESINGWKDGFLGVIVGVLYIVSSQCAGGNQKYPFLFSANGCTSVCAFLDGLKIKLVCYLAPRSLETASTATARTPHAVSCGYEYLWGWRLCRFSYDFSWTAATLARPTRITIRLKPKNNFDLPASETPLGIERPPS
jgi:hypothetical protein